ncbi:hypothetical protein SAMN02745123_00332 [Desulforamulus aeronauticus DSM 10349]|uniref:Uncharacterized protein n=1 Tax=Desulforamulus aeronauticus DSM 10349 TaxID=1121421 RepID=A0A1M6NXZ3_9FIRM|nr:hypothetical protein SAMN02745123_00332 [Desulforamulus aeronauticus DSM 10349]
MDTLMSVLGNLSMYFVKRSVRKYLLWDFARLILWEGLLIMQPFCLAYQKRILLYNDKLAPTNVL